MIAVTSSARIGATHVPRFDPLGRDRVGLGQAPVQLLRAQVVGLRFERGADDRVLGREREVVDRGPEVEAAPAHQERPVDLAEGRMGGALVARHRETLRGLGQVEQVVRNPRPLRRAWVSRCPRPCPGTRASNRPRRSRGRATRPSRAPPRSCRWPWGPRGRAARQLLDAGADGRGDDLAPQVVRAASVMRAWTNAPGVTASSRCTMRFARVRAWAERTLLRGPLHQDLEGLPDLCTVPLGGDRVLELHEPVEPLLDDLLGHLVRASSPPGCPDAASTGRCTPRRSRHAPRGRASRRSPPRSRRGTPR